MAHHPDETARSGTEQAPDALDSYALGTGDVGHEIGALSGPRERLNRRLDALPKWFRQIVSFAFVGGLGFVVQMVLFNILSFTVFEDPSIPLGTLWANAIAIAAAIVTNWVGNRLLTFRDSRREDTVREAVEFVLVSLLGSVIGLATLYVSHYLMHLTSALADNSANIVGLVLGSAVRFVLYRVWVYSPKRRAVIDDDVELVDDPEIIAIGGAPTPAP